MKKMRKFAWIFMAAMTVAGFSACSNSEDEPLPGMGGNGGNGGNGGVTPPPAPTVVLTDTLYDFQDAAGNYVAINDLCPGWTHEIVSPTDDNRTWQTKVYNEEKYIQATAHDSKDGNAGKQYDLWMFTPALDVKNAPEKVFSFYSEGAYWMESSKLEVYVTKAPQSTAEKTLLNPTLATSTAPGGNFKGWVASGDIDLSTYGDTVYVAFRYVAEGGKSKSTTYCIDNVAFGRKQVAMGGTEEPDPDQPDTPDTPNADWSAAITVADALTYDNADKTVISVKGYIVGCLKSGAKSQIADVAAAATEVEMGLETYTGSTTVIIADNAGETDLNKCLWIKLNDKVADYPGAEGLRNAVSLKDHPENIGKVLYAKGKKMAMFSGLPGVRDMEGWKLGE